jgi:hypothetical protein
VCVIKQIPMGSVFNFDYLITHMIETITLNLAPHFFTYRSCPTDLNSKRKLVNVRPDHHIQHNAGPAGSFSNCSPGKHLGDIEEAKQYETPQQSAQSGRSKKVRFNQAVISSMIITCGLFQNARGFVDYATLATPTTSSGLLAAFVFRLFKTGH